MDCGEILLKNLKNCPGRINLPGIRPDVFVVPKTDIVKWPTYPTFGKDKATYQGDFVLRADKVWTILQVVSNKSVVTSESQGEPESQSILNKVTLKYSGTDQDATEFAAIANASDLVYLVRTRAGEFRVIGNEMSNTITKASQALGGSATDEASTTLEVEVTDIMPAPFYTGKIETSDGVVQGDPGKGDEV